MTKRIIFLLFLLQSFVFSKAQNFTGQWKGEFMDNSTSFVGWGGDRCDYVLELECKGRTVSGYSYTYFYQEGKKYFTICKVKGFLTPRAKYVEVKEVERTKTNVPDEIRNCFQVHKLYYSKVNDTTETLEGNWIPAPNQEGNCGRGSTALIRRSLKKHLLMFNRSMARMNKPPVKVASKLTALLKDKNNIKLSSAPTLTKAKPANVQPLVKNNTIIKEEPKLTPSSINKIIPEQKSGLDASSFERRNNKLLKTVEIENETFKVDLYDNGEIDGDSISLFFNGKLILSHQRLTDKAISLTLNVDKSRYVNELVMYAENLGTIPPNTALMIVTDGKNRYEVFISSDLEQSGVIRFVHRPKEGTK